MANPCPHNDVRAAVCDQTLGVKCLDCRTIVGVCWAEQHFSEELWNRACAGDETVEPCDENRHNVCALCGETFGE